MEPKDITNDMIRSALMEALEAIEGADYYGAPWAVDMKLLAEPYVVIYQARDGQTYQRSFSVEIEGDRINTVLSTDRVEVEARTVWIPITEVADAFKFSGDYATATVWTGLIFRAGEYPERRLTFTTDDLKKIVQNFSGPVPLMSEHEESLIGKAISQHGGYLTRVWTANGDTELHGEIKTPGWLDYALQGIKKSVSVGLSNTLDAIREISLVLNPRVTDACVYKAAVAFKTTPDFQAFAAKHPSDAAKIATEAARPPAPAEEPMKKETIKERLQRIFSGKTPEQRAALTEDQIADAIASDDNAPANTQNYTGDPALLARLEVLERENAESKKTNFEREDTDAGLGFYADMLQKGKVAPAERDKVLRDFGNARFKDRHSQETFSANAENSAERALRADYETRPQLFSMTPALSSEGVLPQGGKFGIFSAEEVGAKEETK